MKKRTSYKNKWIQENRERINLLVDKGKKDVIQQHARAHGESMIAFINRAIIETIARDNENETEQ